MVYGSDIQSGCRDPLEGCRGRARRWDPPFWNLALGFLGVSLGTQWDILPSRHGRAMALQ